MSYLLEHPTLAIAIAVIMLASWVLVDLVSRGADSTAVITILAVIVAAVLTAATFFNTYEPLADPPEYDLLP